MAGLDPLTPFALGLKKGLGPATSLSGGGAQNARRWQHRPPDRD